MAKQKLPAPRLQLRWVQQEHMRGHYECHYELVIPLRDCDIRAEQEGPRGGKRPPLTEVAIPMKPPSLRQSTATPCREFPSGVPYYDPPYRDGSHAIWDAEALGGLPIYVIDLDGTAFNRAAQPAQAGADRAGG